jgi:hypothetical protein
MNTMAGLRYVLFSPNISSLQPKNSRRGEFFYICTNVWVFEYLLFLRTSAYFNGTEHEKQYLYYCKKTCMIVILYYHWPSKKNEFSRRSSENFGAEILNNLNSMKHMLNGRLPLNFIPMKYKVLLAEKRWERLLFNKTVTIYPIHPLS